MQPFKGALLRFLNSIDLVIFIHLTHNFLCIGSTRNIVLVAKKYILLPLHGISFGLLRFSLPKNDTNFTMYNLN
jgi:hypothetical protein